MKIAITGATGLVGRGLLEVFSQEHPDWELTALSRSPLPPGHSCRWMPLDVSDTEATYKTITKLNPDLIIHAGAMARPEACEKEREGAFQTNVIGTRNVALACLRFDTELVFISTDQVFYGAKREVNGEYDEPKSDNYYAYTKILGEKFVREHLQRWWIVRMGKVFGGPNDTYSFVHTAHQMLSQNRPMRVVHDWRAHMMHASHYAQCLAKIIEKKTYGIYHIAHPAVPSYQEVAEHLAEVMGAPQKLLTPVSREQLQKELGLTAVRAAHLELSASMWKADFGKDAPSWKEGIRLFVSERARKVS